MIPMDRKQEVDCMPSVISELSGMINQKLTEVPPSVIRAFDNEISSVPGIIKLTLGEPDFAVPDHVKMAAVKSIAEDDSHYSQSAGKIELREAIAAYLKRTRNVDYDPASEIVVAVGATEALAACTFALLNPGDKVLVPTPVFPLYFPLISLTGAEVVMINTAPEGFVLTPERLKKVLEEEGSSVKAILLNYPSNPTGRSYSAKLLDELAEILKEHHLLVLADEIYSELTYDAEHSSLATRLPGQTLLISGLSKSHAMTGYRLGYVAGPSQLIGAVTKMHAFMVTCINDSAQAAAVEALNHGDNDPVVFREAYRHRRDYMVGRMRKMGFEMAVPEGAFYVFAQIPKEFGTDDFAFALRLAKEGRLGIIPGSVFGSGGEGYVRISYAASDEKIEEAMNRLEEFVSHI